MTAVRPHQLTMEPDRAREVVVNLIRKHRSFAVELDPSLKDLDGGSLKDVVCVAIGGELEQRATHDYATGIVARTVDEACHFALGLLRGEICFFVRATTRGDSAEWEFTAEKEKRRGIGGR